jgi:hypothetical protein
MSNPSLHALADMLGHPDVDQTPLPDGTMVILDIPGHQVVSLSQTATYIVSLLREGVRDQEELVARIAARYEIDEATAHADAGKFIQELIQTLADAPDPDR